MKPRVLGLLGAFCNLKSWLNFEKDACLLFGGWAVQDKSEIVIGGHSPPKGDLVKSCLLLDHILRGAKSETRLYW